MGRKPACPWLWRQKLSLSSKAVCYTHILEKQVPLFRGYVETRKTMENCALIGNIPTLLMRKLGSRKVK